MAGKISAKGMILKFGATASPTTAVPFIDALGIDPGDRDHIDVTSHDSTTTMEHVDSGLRETPLITGSIFYDPTNAVHESIRAAHAAGTPIYATVVAPDTGAAAWACYGTVEQFKIPDRKPKDPLVANFAIKAMSADTFTQ
jgi:hypothetical protein